MTQTAEAAAATGADDAIVEPGSASGGTQDGGLDSAATSTVATSTAATSGAAASDGATSGARLVAGRYRLIEPLGRGGMGRVYRGNDDLLDRPVAVKLIYDDAVSDRDLRRACAVEARAAARLSHPGIVRILDSGFDDGHCFVVMELAEGPTLAEILRDEGALPVDRALGLAAQLADALEAAHREGVIHCDVKPGNVIVDTLNRTRLVDFGIARVVTSTTGLSDTDIQGSAKYVAPEQVEGGSVDGRTDLYALGVVLYEMLAGQPPFTGGNLASILAQRLVSEPPSLRAVRPDVPPQVEQIVRRAMERDPAHRYQTAGDFRDALRSARDEAPGATTMPIGAFAAMRQPQESQSAPIWAGAAVAVPMAVSAVRSGRRLVGSLATALPASLPRLPLAWPSRWPSLGTGVAMASLLGLLVGVMAAQCVTAGMATESALSAPPVEAATAQDEVVQPTLIPAPAVAATPTDAPPAPTQTAVPPTSTLPPPTDTPPTAEPAPPPAPAVVAAPRVRAPAPVQSLNVELPATAAPEAESPAADDRDQPGPPSDRKPEEKDEKKPDPKRFEAPKPTTPPTPSKPAPSVPGGPDPHPQPWPTQVEPPKPAPKPQPAAKPQEAPRVEMRQPQPPPSSQGNGDKSKEKSKDKR